VTYDGDGNGNGNGATKTSPPADNLTVTMDINHSKTLLASKAGESYDPAILATIQGSTDFDMLFTTAFSANFNGVENLNLGVTGTVSMTYDYESVPEPPTMLLLSFSLIGLAGCRRRFSKKQ
jgi:hypothetical protein